MQRVEIKVSLAEGAELPLYATEHAAGADLFAYMDKEILLSPKERILVPTGLRLALPFGFEAQIRPRSGLALKEGITVLNTPGTIDSDYRGEIKILLINLGSEPFVIQPRMRLAQLVISPVLQALFIEEELLAKTYRGEGGFGHTGV
ncbi:MAG: deoxyuridine 5'-triphosphate nucleotidohydrolase [Chlamydiae bacterium GWC2_50_10]|nr:MAG: deoxyuridine 5'-triphosphate nucleotidohydrolase [Chlamydiae bacterium GWC2_50_10]OGN55132.1 MAG: deoxyuridine 5'-triphosphate nucleotidohydrolase [Chlamydiae bacterium GWF2_49_8]OGN57987.1 MAG: deoxyuridine 5'-triphosphate nucleotidohydrolase [Chlamydiae bacterium RIFCSPHIGHO2_02_FULL_49_29]OGN63185.1 MAG: deoxyuridine 5'-triphosphate nucleotidohydrolase [Chlamydiae bacterium RIFCSPHIGHO2_12_FULL_49_32]OGN67623.1 MAG: deoxyuridine 5'-triphosphate nucleotidohydrolase [Chlamydiae bacteri